MDPEHSVRLLIGRNPNRLITESKFATPYWDQLVDNSNLTIQSKTYDLFNSENVAALIADYSDIVTLEISASAISLIQLEQINYLLFHCCAKLKTLKLYLTFDLTCMHLNSSLLMNKLMQSINSMPSLEHLTLEVFAELNLNSEDNLNLSFITRLKEFYFFSQNESVNLFETVKHYLESRENSSRLEKIGLNSYDKMEINSILENSSLKSTNKFARIPQISAIKDPSELANLCEKFTRLTLLSIWKCSLSLSQLASCLKPLNQLICLRVQTTRVPLSLDDHIESNNIAQLESIKVLILSRHCLIESHNDLHSSHFNWIFPSVQIVEVYHDHFECFICKIDHQRKVDPIQRKQCIRLMLQPWKENQQLRKIYTKFSTKYTEWTIDEL